MYFDQGEAVRDGCPAHAGIDPMQREWKMGALGLPRTRGDRP